MLSEGGELRPEPAVVGIAAPASRRADGLTGESAGQNVNWFNVTSSKLTHISVNRHARPVFVEYPHAKRIDFAKPARLKSARHPESEVDPADTAEQRANGEIHRPTP